jgi:hypothetical protein
MLWTLKELSAWRWRLLGRPYGSGPRAEISLLCLECPRRRLDGVLDTEDPPCENGGEVYCGCELGGGAACCGPVALRFFGEEV